MKAPSEEIYSKSTRNKEHNVEKYIQWLTIRVYLHSLSEICEIPRNSPKIRTHSSSRSSKAMDLGANGKHISNFLLLINSNFVHISYRFRDIDVFRSKIACFPSDPCLMPPSRGTPCDMNVNIYIAEKHT